MIVFVDNSCFPYAGDEARKKVIEFCDGLEIDLRIADVGTLTVSQRQDIVAITGLGLAAASLAISYIQLLRTPRPTFTRSQLIEEIESFLKLNGVTDYKFAFEEGFENLVAKNGRACVVGITIGASESIQLFIAATPDKLYVTAAEVNWRSIT